MRKNNELILLSFFCLFIISLLPLSTFFLIIITGLLLQDAIAAGFVGLGVGLITIIVVPIALILVSMMAFYLRNLLLIQVVMTTYLLLGLAIYFFINHYLAVTCSILILHFFLVLTLQVLWMKKNDFTVKEVLSEFKVISSRLKNIQRKW